MIKKKKYNYFQAYQLMTECAYQAAFELMKMMKDYQPNAIDVHLQKMHRIEHEADLRRHEIMTVLAKDSRPPMDRSISLLSLFSKTVSLISLLRRKC